VDPALKEKMAKADEFARNRRLGEARLLADELTMQFAEEMQVWLLRSYLCALGEEYTQAILDLDRAIDLNSLEPHLFYSRGTYQFYLGNYTSALSDFTKGLDLCDFHQNDYYREELHFWRAEASLRLGRRLDALNDLSKVRSDFVTWTSRLRTKDHLLAEIDL
jgi:tetratricopeptide (TPR) repeat protein